MRTGKIMDNCQLAMEMEMEMEMGMAWPHGRMGMGMGMDASIGFPPLLLSPASCVLCRGLQ